MKLQNKLIAGFGLVAFITLVVAGIGYWQTQRLASALYEVGVVRLPSIQGLEMMGNAMTVIEGSTRSLLQPGSDAQGNEESRRQAEAWANFDRGWKIYEPLPQTPDEARLWAEFVPVVRAWRAENEALKARATPGVRFRLATTPATTAPPAPVPSPSPQYARARALLAEITALNHRVIDEAKAQSVASYRDVALVRAVMLATAATGVLGAIGLAILLGRRISRPITEISGALAAVGQGNLSVELQNRSPDEIGQAARGLNRMVEAMRTSQAMLRALSDNLPASMLYQVVREPDGRMRFLHLSAGVQALHGLSAEAVLADAEVLYGQVLPEDRPALAAAEQASEQAMAILNLEVRVRRPDGTVRWMHICSQPRRLPDGRMAWDGIETDITESKRNGEALRESEARFRTIVSQSTIGMGLLSLDGRSIAFNPALLRILGYAEEEGSTLDLAVITHPDDLEASRRQLDRLKAGEIDFYELDKRYLHKSGRVVWGNGSMALMRDTAGRPQYFLAQIQDVTERKLTAIALAESKDRLEVALQVSRLGVWRRNLQTGVMEWDARMFGIFGLDPAGGVPDYDGFIATVLPEDRAAVAAAWQRFIAGAAAFEVQFRILRPDGDVRHIRAQSALHRGEGSQPSWIVGVDADLTEFIRATEETGRLREQLRQAQKMEILGTLSAGVAHDFNNLLTGINGFIDLSSASLPPDHEVVELLKQARSGANSARDLVRRILSFSRSTQATDRQVAPLTLLVRDTAPLITAGLPAQVTLTIDVADSTPAVHADLGQIQQVLLNLCVNGAHAIGAGSGSIRIGLAELVVTGETAVEPPGQARPGRYACLSVADTGCGMAPEVRARIFEPFFTTKKAGEGTGLGLAMVQEIVTSHNGFVRVQSEVGRGTTFEICLPAAVAPAAVTPDSTANGSICQPGRGERIFIVDDEPAVRSIVQAALERSGFITEMFEDSPTAWARFKEDPAGCALLLTDLQMPELSGVDLAVRARHHSATVPIVIMTARTEVLNLAKLREIGGVGVLAKPFGITELLDRVTASLQGHSGAEPAAGPFTARPVPPLPRSEPNPPLPQP